MPLIGRLAVRAGRSELVLIDPAEVSPPDADGPAAVAAPPAVGPAPRFQGAVVPSEIDEHLDQLGGAVGRTTTPPLAALVLRRHQLVAWTRTRTTGRKAGPWRLPAAIAIVSPI